MSGATDHNHEAESAQVTRVRCEGAGTLAKNVGRFWVGRSLPMGGDCQACGQKVEITRKWTTKYHTVRVVTPPATADGGDRG